MIQRTNRTQQVELIASLNPVMRGWANYHRHCVAKRTFSGWTSRSVRNSCGSGPTAGIPEKPFPWIVDRYCHHLRQGGGHLRRDTGERNQKASRSGSGWSMPAVFPSGGTSKSKADANPFDPTWGRYFAERAFRQRFGITRQQAGIQTVVNDRLSLTGWLTHCLAYDQIGGPRMVYAACWAHARRQFFETVQLNPRDPVATPIVARIDELFAVDAEARCKALSVGARHIRRHERAKPLLDDIRSKIDAAQSIALPSSALSKACQYALTLWRKLTRFLEYPELELSNNLAENSMRPVALGRNYAQSAIMGSPQAA